MTRTDPSSVDHAAASVAGVTSAGAPVRVAQVALTVRDRETVSRFYRDVVGLRTLARDGDVESLGAGATPLLELRHDPQARREDPRSAGLFHTAFLLPDRAALANWFAHAAEADVGLDGASDHLVSEAFYLSDPEGNGVEIYADRPSETWARRDGLVEMATKRLDLRSLSADASGRWSGAPEGTIVGHAHLRVGGLDDAERFYSGVLGLDVACRYPGATFFGSGGYHHHVAGNVWRSDGAPRRAAGTTGLAEVRLAAESDAFEAIRSRAAADGETDRLALIDPWGLPVIVTRS